MLKHGIILPLLSKSKLNKQFTTSFPQIYFSPYKILFIQKLLNEALELGVLSSTSNNSKIFSNNIFVVAQEQRTTKQRQFLI